MKARVKISYYFKQFKSLFGNRVRKPFASNIFACKSIFNHNFTMRFFDNKIFFNFWKKIIKHFSCGLPVKNWSTKCFFTSPTISRIFRTSKSIFKPNNKTFITTGNFKHGMPLIAIAILTLFGASDIEAPFSINKTCQIRNFSNRMFCFENNFSSHDHLFFYYNTIINEKQYLVRVERLNEKTFLKGCDSLTSTTKGGEEDPKSSSRLEIGHKSNRMVLNETASLLAQSLRETDDELSRNMLEATASFINCVNGTNGDSPTELTRADIDAVVFALINNSARMISDNIEGEDRFATAPIREAYWAMCNSSVLPNLENVDGFINTAQYPAQMNTLHAEWCSVGNIRWLYSPIGSVTENASVLGNDIFNCFVTGREAYAVVDQDGASAEFIYQGLGSGNDPLLQRQTAGYKFAQVPRILNDAWIINLRTTLA